MRILSRSIFRMLMILNSLLFLAGCSGGPTKPNLGPPGIILRSPTHFPFNLVEDGIPLSLTGAFLRADRVEALVDGKVVASLNGGGNSATLDVWQFGSFGSKSLLIRATGSGGTVEKSIDIVHDPEELKQQAIEEIRRGWVESDGGTHRMAGNTVHIYTIFPEMIPYIDGAIPYLEKWTGLHFERTDREDLNSSILILESPDYTRIFIHQHPWHTITHTDFMLALHDLQFYQNVEEQYGIERAVILLLPVLLTNIGQRRPADIPNTIFNHFKKAILFYPTYMEKAVRMIYNHSPGWIPN